MNHDDEFDDSSSKVKFGSEEFRRPARFCVSETPKIIRWVIKYSCGLVKNEKQANYVLLGFVATMIVISLFLVFGSGENISEKPTLDLINSPQPEEGYISR